ncbi:MAG TPA: response regulator transcription factor [Burkholderiales bacterium]|jgi:DNA-binding NarL/FixJ family response regulator|nr:response regulator transcription factor [Burkholderiales bacterium]
MKVLIADDHAVVRRGLRQILEAEPDLKVSGEATSGAEVMEALRMQRYDVAVLDITMPDRGGLEVLQEIRQNFPELRVLILSMHPEERYALRVLKAGAAGYLTKESAAEELISALRKVAAGGRYVSPTLAERLADEIGTETDKSPHERLSDREHQILCMIASGMTVSGIASKLRLGTNTVSTYRARLLGKLKLANNAELTHYAIRNRLVD